MANTMGKRINMFQWMMTSFNMQTPPCLVRFRQLLTDGAPTSPQPTALGIDSSHAPCSFLSATTRTWWQKAKGCCCVSELATLSTGDTSTFARQNHGIAPSKLRTLSPTIATDLLITLAISEVHRTIGCDLSPKAYDPPLRGPLHRYTRSHRTQRGGAPT